MEITHGCINVLLLLQKMFHPPLQIFLINAEVHARCQYYPFRPCKSSKDRKAKNIWNLNNVLFKIAVLFVALRCGFLFHHWNEDNNIEQLCCYAGAFAIGILVLFTFHCYQSDLEEFSYVFPQALKIAKFVWKGYPSSILKVVHEKATVVYGYFFFYLISIPAASTATVLVLDYHPIRLIAKWILMNMKISDLAYLKTVTNIFSNFIYCSLSIYGGGIWLSLLVIMLAFAEAMMIISKQLGNRKYCFTMTTSKTKEQFKRSVSFANKLVVYRTTNILIRLGCQLISNYAQCLIVMGILLATCSGCVLVKLYDDLPFLLYSCMSMLLPLLAMINFGLITLASIPHENGEKFRYFWKKQFVSRMDRMKLKSCPPIGYSFGFIKNCERKTSLIIVDVSLNLIASVTLLI